MLANYLNSFFAIPFLLALITISTLDPDFSWPIDQLVTQSCTYNQITIGPFTFNIPFTEKNCSDSICTQAKNNKRLQFDYVIVGAGSAGALLAYRLATNQPNRTVLLIEAGGDPLAQSVPPRFYSYSLNTSATFDYKTVLNPNASQAFENGTTSGKCLGGSTTTSTMSSVCGNDRNFDEWAQLIKDDSWNYTNFKQYLKKHENMSDSSLKSGSCASYHSTEGPISVSDVGETIDWFSPTVKSAFQEKSYRSINDINCGGPYTGYANVRMYIRNGRRETTARACLTKLKDKSNFYLMKNSFVKSLITRTTSGSEFFAPGVVVSTNQSDCSGIDIHAKREIILSAGAQNTPKILLQSGIGRNDSLCSNVQQSLNLNVGNNRQEHIQTVHFFTVPETNNSQLLQIFNISANLGIESALYLLNGSGFFSYDSGWNLQAFVNVTNNSSPYPEVSFSFTRFRQMTFEFTTILKGYGFKQQYIDQILNASKTNSVLMAFNTLQEPQSRGTVRLSSCSDPLATPIVNTNFLSNSNDSDTLLKGINELYALMNTTTMINFGVKDLMINITECNAFPRYTEAYNRCYMKYFSTGDRNACGTAKMGDRSDPDAVVDKNFKVIGITESNNYPKLRIVDSSIFPKIPMGDIQCTIFGVAEKAADLIINDNP